MVPSRRAPRLKERGISMSALATLRIVAQVAAKVLSAKPRKGLTATKCFSGQRGAILRHAPRMAASSASRSLDLESWSLASTECSWTIAALVAFTSGSPQGGVGVGVWPCRPEPEHKPVRHGVEVKALREMDVKRVPPRRL